MKKLLNAFKVTVLLGVVTLTGVSLFPSQADALQIDLIACWEPGGDACSVTTSCGEGCTQTQNYKNWLIIFEE